MENEETKNEETKNEETKCREAKGQTAFVPSIGAADPMGAPKVMDVSTPHAVPTPYVHDNAERPPLDVAKMWGQVAEIQRTLTEAPMKAPVKDGEAEIQRTLTEAPMKAPVKDGEAEK
jgi:hypothetical protein